jgi:hypothetical protein
MPPLIVQDPTIGNELSQALGSIAQGPQMFKLGVETRKLLDEQRARNAYIEANKASFENMKPPSVPLPTGWEGPPSPPNEEETRNFNIARNRQFSVAQLGGRLASSYGDLATNDPKTMGQSQVAMYGMPQTKEGLLKLNTQLEGKIPDALFTPKGLTDADMNERWGQLQVLATNGNLTPAQANEAKVLQGFKNKNKVSTSPTGDVTVHPEYDLSPLEANLMKKAEAALAMVQPTTTGASAQAGSTGVPTTAAAATPAQPLPEPAQQAAPLAARGAVQTVPDTSTAGPPITPAAAAAAPGAAPAPAPTGAPAAPSPTTTTVLPGGGKVTVTRGTGGVSSQEQLNVTSAVQRAGAARRQLEPIIGVDAQGKINPNNYYVPNRVSAQISQSYGTNMAGATAANAIEAVAGGGDKDRNVGDYYTVARQWVEPVIRLASGAAINPSEYANYFSMFIPNAIDRPKTVQLKVDAMRAWETATARASSPAQAQEIMAQIAGNNPYAVRAVETMRVLGTQNGTNDKTYAQLGIAPGGASTPQPGAPAQAPTAAPATAPSQGAPPARMRYDATGNRIQ